MRNTVGKKIFIFLMVATFVINIFPAGNTLHRDQSLCEEVPLTGKQCLSKWMPSYRWRARNIKVRFTETVENTGNYSVNITVYIPKPRSLFSQEINEPVKYNPIPDGVKIDRWGQEVVYYNEIITPGHNLTLSGEINATIYSIRYVLLPWLVSDEIPDDIKTKYTADDTKYQINDSCIQNIVEKVVGDTNNILLKAIKLHNYVGNWKGRGHR